MADRTVFDQAVEIAREITLGKRDPHRGAVAIWALMAEQAGEYPEPLRPFVGLASEWQDDPDHRTILEAGIRNEAARLVADAS